MKTLKEYKAYIKEFFESTADHEPGETWSDYWRCVRETLEEEKAIVTINGKKYVKE